MSRFKELRKKIGLTQEELIEQFNLNYGKKYTPAAISQFENNKRITETHSLADFANFFGVSIEYLLERESHVPSIQLRQEEQELIRAYRRAPDNITVAICKLLEPYSKDND